MSRAPAEAEVSAVAGRLETAMRRAGAWSDPLPSLPPFRQAFGMDAMPFVHWLQGVLLPRLHEVARGASPMPPNSDLAAHAVREFDGDDRMAPVIDVLRQVDALCPPAPTPAASAPARGIGGLLALANLLTAIGIAVGLWVSQWAEREFAPRFPRHVSHVYHGSLAPAERFAPMRLSIVNEIGDGGVLGDARADVTLLVQRAPLQPIVPGRVEPPLTMQVTDRVEVEAVADWIARSGAPDSPARFAAAAELAQIHAVVVGARTRADLDSIAQRLPPGLPEPQIVEIEGHVPQGLSIGIAIVAGLMCALPLVLFAARRIRGRRHHA